MTTQTKPDPVREAFNGYWYAGGAGKWADEGAERTAWPAWQAAYAQARADLLAEMQPVAWVASDTLTSPHPRCVSSLAYVSQIDQNRGREYVALAIIPKE